jgi:hypothetical protein
MSAEEEIKNQKWECPNDGTDLTELIRQHKVEGMFSRIEATTELSFDPFVKCPGACGLKVKPRFTGPFIPYSPHLG